MELAADAAAQLQLDAAVLACFLKRQSPLMATHRRHASPISPHRTERSAATSTEVVRIKT